MDSPRPPHTFYIGFDGAQVAVDSYCHEVTSVLQRLYRDLLVSEPAELLGQLEVCEHDGTYQLLSTTGVSSEASSLEEIIPALRDEVVLRLIDRHRQLLWLHAGAAASHGSAVVVSGGSGKGKSTTVTSLCAQGWTFLSDDLLPLDMTRHLVLPFPQMPQFRQNPGEHLSSDRLGELTKREVDLPKESICREGMPIAAIIFPQFEYDAAPELIPLTGATAVSKLLENCANYSVHQQTAVEYLCALVQRVPVFSLPFHIGSTAANLVMKAHEQWSGGSPDVNPHFLSSVDP